MELIDERINKYSVKVFYNGCVKRGDGSSFRRKAHAHVIGDFKGWICFRSMKRVYMASGKPSLLMWHEVAHCLVNPSYWHNKIWNKKRLELIRDNR